ncbi:Protein F55A4.7 [Aphelenchoides avenae]|nr:Protein F55A4.7 [Aphelenchus avenae]
MAFAQGFRTRACLYMSDQRDGDPMEDEEQQSASEYSRQQEERHKRKVILPCVIPWEYGSNKFASQKGSGGFGTIRNINVKVHSSKPLSDSNDGVVPWHSCPCMKGKLATQAGSTPFGTFRENVTHVRDKEKKRVNDLLLDPKATERVLKLWSQANPEAKNNQMYGKRRNVIAESVGGRRFTDEEIMKSHASLPRFQCVAETSAAKDARAGEAPVTGYQPHRQVTTTINGLERTVQDQLDSNRYMAWLGGQLTLQSQSRTGGFQKPRDVVSTSYYDRLMCERELSPAELHRLREERRRKLLETVEVNEPTGQGADPEEAHAADKEEQEESVASDEEEIEEEEEDDGAEPNDDFVPTNHYYKTHK